MDHAHIRGLVTGISSFRRGAACALVSGDHRLRCPRSLIEGSPHRRLRIALRTELAELLGRHEENRRHLEEQRGYLLSTRAFVATEDVFHSTGRVRPAARGGFFP